MNASHPTPAPRRALALSLGACLGLLPGADLPAWQGEPQQPEHVAILASRFLTMDGAPIDGGVMLIEDGRITAIGRARELLIPDGFEVRDLGPKLVAPGFVDLHHHVSAGGGDINDMVAPTNPELRTLDTVRPSNELIAQTMQGGVTTTLFIPGSGTNIGGFGVLLKMRGGSLEDMVLRELGAMKVAQGYNPERRGGDLGGTRMGMHELLTDTLRRGQTYAAAWREFEAGRSSDRPERRPDLDQLRQVFDRKVPVIIHTAGARDCLATARMFQDVFQTWMILSHGTFDGHWAASALSKRHTPVNLGPRSFDLTRDGKIQGIAAGYWEVGCTDLSINTDAPVIPPEQLSLQAAMAARLGLPYEAAMRALTIVPARQVGIDHRVGSLSPGKDADFIVTSGDPLDPRHPVEQVYIEGRLVYQLGENK